MPMANHTAHEIEGPSDAELADSVAAGYEKQDVSLSVLLRWGFFLGVFLVATSIFGFLLFIAIQYPPFGPPPIAKSAIRPAAFPSAGTPVVQDNPAGDLREDNNRLKGIDNIRTFRHDEEIRMNEYATQDGNIHIPLDRAMELGIKEFDAQLPGEPPTGVTPTKDMKIHANLNEGSSSDAPHSRTGVTARP